VTNSCAPHPHQIGLGGWRQGLSLIDEYRTSTYQVPLQVPGRRDENGARAAGHEEGAALTGDATTSPRAGMAPLQAVDHQRSRPCWIARAPCETLAAALSRTDSGRCSISLQTPVPNCPSAALRRSPEMATLEAVPSSPSAVSAISGRSISWSANPARGASTHMLHRSPSHS